MYNSIYVLSYLLNKHLKHFRENKFDLLNFTGMENNVDKEKLKGDVSKFKLISGE